MTHGTNEHGKPRSGNLDVTWHAGWPSAKHDSAPEIQVHAYDADTVILRQNKSVHYEAPFMFLLFGARRALLLDTGATEEERYFPLRRTVDGLVAEWLERHPEVPALGYGLLVAHTHGHGDHVAGDGQFAGRADTVVVGHGVTEVAGAFGLAGWPEGLGELDLGGRVLDLIPGPGHQSAALVMYDRRTGLLFTGDSFYPGRIYVQDPEVFAATVDRLVAFCEAHPVTHILGCHIEMTTTPGEDYPRGTTYQPDEPPLQLTVGQLRTLRDVLAEADGRPGVYGSADFVVHIDG